MSSARDELVDIQQRLVEELKENIYDTVGRNDDELDAYYHDYQSEFQAGFERLSTRDEIVQRLMREDTRYPAPSATIWTPLIDIGSWTATAPRWRGAGV